MKYLLLIFTFLCTTFSYSQFIQTLEEDNEWSVAYSDFWSGGITNIDKITLFGEEVINSKTYKKVYRDGVLSSCRLREENGIIFSYEASTNDEKVMLDLNSEIGDIINEDYFCLGGGGETIWEYKVVDINIEFIAGEDRKIITIEGFDFNGDPFDYFEYWIEGIGSTKGLVPFGFNFDFDNLLTCFAKNGEITYFNEFNQCNPPLSIDEFNSIKSTLYPNPVIDNSILQFPSEEYADTIRIFDLQGKLVHIEAITTDYFIIDAMQYRSGLYFYQVLNNTKLIASDKFIVK